MAVAIVIAWSHVSATRDPDPRAWDHVQGTLLLGLTEAYPLTKASRAGLTAFGDSFAAILSFATFRDGFVAYRAEGQERYKEYLELRVHLGNHSSKAARLTLGVPARCSAY